MQTIPARVYSTSAAFPHEACAAEVTYAATTERQQQFHLHWHRDGQEDPDFYGINNTI